MAGQHLVLRPQKTPDPKAWSQEDPCSGSQLSELPTSLSNRPAPGTLHLSSPLPSQAMPPSGEVSFIRHEGPASSRAWPAEQSHCKCWTHRSGGVSMNFGNLKTPVHLSQAILFPTSRLTARSQRKGQTPIQSPVNSRGERRAPLSGTGPGLGRGVWGG